MLEASAREYDEVSVIQGLTAASDLGWSGVLYVSSGREQVGAVVMRDGRVAWAVCKYQRENLGTYLKRQGHITAGRFSAVMRRYEALGRTKKLAALLEEEGIADHATLQSCLKQHVQRALACMAALTGYTISARGAEFKVEEEHTFALRELLALAEDCACAVESLEPMGPLSSGDALPENSLSELASLPGYKASLIGTLDGRLLAFHTFDEKTDDCRALAGIPAAWLDCVSTMSNDVELAKQSTTVIEGELGAILARWIRPEFGIFVAVFLNTEGRVGAARHRIDKVATTLQGRLLVAHQA